MTTLSTRTTVFGATNPKGQYDSNECTALNISIELSYLIVKEQRTVFHYFRHRVFTSAVLYYNNSSTFSHLIRVTFETHPVVA